jgi:type III pantothenate kinase
MRFKALNNYTQKLPLIESTENFPELGEDTKTAILSGVEKGIIYEMEGYINDFKKQHPKLSIFLTGGDTFFFETKLKYRIFASKNLLLIGLNTILNYNLKNV